LSSKEVEKMLKKPIRGYCKHQWRTQKRAPAKTKKQSQEGKGSKTHIIANPEKEQEVKSRRGP